MNFFARRRLKKTVHGVRHLVRHAQRMREDVAPPADLAAARAAEAALDAAWRARAWDRLEAACEAAAAAAEKLLPPRPFPKWRENVEVLVVAISLAMACRTYFIQPFKIPTGSMQPTLNGVTARPQEGREWYDRPPFNLVNLALFGERYVEVRARNSGRLEFAGNLNDQYVLRIGAELYPLWIAMKPDSPFFNPDPDKSMKLRFNLGDRVEAGQLIASGRVRQGDHVFVNKVANNFARPQRGQVVVFDTNYIPEKERLGIRPDSFYIKRLVGLPGETVSIRDRHLVVDGRPVTEPFPFRRLTTDPRYRGYVPRPHSRLPEEGAEIRLGEKQFLPFGDNTYSSLDGRYFGPVSEQALVGPSFFVYWPLGPHWGWSR
ncbi:MAG TPA: signal peptidase I [Kiritimatiellia bacterium]|nr:signal peptidase I [Kiritimatiellia bacterium]